jgi:primosomal protein N''
MRAMDARLLSTAQAVAGARCHESNNLLQSYYYAAHACGRLPAVEREAARQDLREAEAALRRFVSECRQLEIARPRRRILAIA